MSLAKDHPILAIRLDVYLGTPDAASMHCFVYL